MHFLIWNSHGWLIIEKFDYLFKIRFWEFSKMPTFNFHQFNFLLMLSMISQCQSRSSYQYQENITHNIKTEVSSYIVNGFNTPFGRDFFVSLAHSNFETYCGAGILEPYWVITAAHCIAHLPGNSFSLKNVYKFQKKKQTKNLFKSQI